MNFSFEDRKAVYCIARAMVFADGNVDDNEMQALAGEMFRIGSNPDEILGFEDSLSDYEPSDAIDRISRFDAEKKKYFCAFLGALIVVDGDVDDNEVKLWALTSRFCGLPTMTIKEAFEYMANL